MFVITHSSNKKLFLAAFSGAALFYLVNFLLDGDSNSRHKIQSLEEKVASLEAELASKEDQLNNKNPLGGNEKYLGAGNARALVCKPTEKENQKHKEITKLKIENSSTTLKSLETASANDRRTYSEKINELLSSGASNENLALAMRSIFNMSHDTDHASDFELQSIYSAQSNPDLRILIAQVLAQRGNNILLDGQISDAKIQLKSDASSDRQEALNQLAKLHNVKAVDAIVPLLQDSDVNVKLDALQALRSTGNESHISLVERMVNDPDVAVSSLASDVLSELKNLSRYARTSISSQDIAAELPIIEN